VPRQGELLEILDIDAVAGARPELRAAVKRLAEEQAPQTVAQLVLWQVRTGLDWSQLEAPARRWANTHEFALARRFVSRLDPTAGRPAVAGSLDIDVDGSAPGSEPRAARLRAQLEGRTMLGLKVRLRPAGSPHGPAIACQVRLDQAVASVRVLSTDETGTRWRPAGDFDLAHTDPGGTERPAVEIADALARGILDRLVRAELLPGPRVKGKPTYRIRIDNGSPLVLTGLALAAPTSDPEAAPSPLLGLALPPKKRLAVPASPEAVRRLRLAEGVRIEGVALSELD
jgi:hypothetical protein